jgi:hypothetical protein
MTRTLLIPPFFIPGTAQIAPTQITFELVNAAGQSIAGLTALHGIVGRKTLTATDEEQELELEVNDDIVPFSMWQVTITSGNVQQVARATLQAWDSSSEEEPLALADFLYPTA